VDHALRLYDSPFKQSAYLCASLVFVAVSLALLHDPKTRANVEDVVGAYLGIGFFGLCAVVFIVQMVRALLVRRPLLQVDALGWTYAPALGGHSQHVSWEDVGSVGLYRQRLTRTKMFYLVLEARHPTAQPPSRALTMATNLYPVLSRVVLFVPLNAVLMRMSPVTVKRLLGRIQAEFADELLRYGVAVADAIQDM
jgi:hypothetical protein